MQKVQNGEIEYLESCVRLWSVGRKNKKDKFLETIVYKWPLVKGVVLQGSLDICLNSPYLSDRRKEGQWRVSPSGMSPKYKSI